MTNTISLLDIDRMINNNEKGRLSHHIEQCAQGLESAFDDKSIPSIIKIHYREMVLTHLNYSLSEAEKKGITLAAECQLRGWLITMKAQLQRIEELQLVMDGTLKDPLIHDFYHEHGDLKILMQEFKTDLSSVKKTIGRIGISSVLSSN